MNDPTDLAVGSDARVQGRQQPPLQQQQQQYQPQFPLSHSALTSAGPMPFGVAASAVPRPTLAPVPESSTYTRRSSLKPSPKRWSTTGAMSGVAPLSKAPVLAGPSEPLPVTAAALSSLPEGGRAVIRPRRSSAPVSVNSTMDSVDNLMAPTSSFGVADVSWSVTGDASVLRPSNSASGAAVPGSGAATGTQL